MIELIFSMALALQVQVPTAPASTWDGVPGSDVVRTDEATGEITYPMGQQPSDALALGCVFGRSNVRCPRPVEPPSPRGTGSGGDWRTSGSGRFGDIEFASADEDPLATQEGDASAFDWFAEAYIKDPAGLTIAQQIAAAEPPTDLFPSDKPASGFEIDPVNGENEKSVEAEPEEQPEPGAGCRREEYRYEDGSGYGVRIACSSGDQRLLESVMEGLRPSPQ